MNKDYFAKAWFDEFQSKIDTLQILSTLKPQGRFLQDEAFTLCLVYLDRLSNQAHPFVSETASSKRFCQLLIDYSGDELFKKICFRQLLLKFNGGNSELKKIAQKMIASLKSIGCELHQDNLCFNTEISTIPSELYVKFYEPTDFMALVKTHNILSDQKDLKRLDIDLWRGTIASIAYEYMRCQSIHLSAIGTLSFGNEERLNFDVLYQALVNIFSTFKTLYEKEGKFLGFNEGEHELSFTPTV